jgi:hypothetical protein
MRTTICAVCQKPIGQHERRFVERLRVPLLRRLFSLKRTLEIHTHAACKRKATTRTVSWRA